MVVLGEADGGGLEVDFVAEAEEVDICGCGCGCGRGRPSRLGVIDDDV